MTSTAAPPAAVLEPDGRCIECQPPAPIRWVLTLGSRRWPLDPEPVDGGTVVLVTTEDGRVRARILTGPELPAEGPAYRMHACWSGRPKPTRGPRCRRCQDPMDPVLARHERWVEHPCCEPQYLRLLAAQGLST